MFQVLQYRNHTGVTVNCEWKFKRVRGAFKILTYKLSLRYYIPIIDMLTYRESMTQKPWSETRDGTMPYLDTCFFPPWIRCPCVYQCPINWKWEEDNITAIVSALCCSTCKLLKTRRHFVKRKAQICQIKIYREVPSTVYTNQQHCFNAEAD